MWVRESLALPLVQRNATGDITVGGHGKDERQLLQIGTMVLRVVWLATPLEVCGDRSYVASLFQRTESPRSRRGFGHIIRDSENGLSFLKEVTPCSNYSSPVRLQ